MTAAGLNATGQEAAAARRQQADAWLGEPGCQLTPTCDGSEWLAPSRPRCSAAASPPPWSRLEGGT